MRFCILGTDFYNSDELRTKRPVYQSCNLEEAVRMFQQFVNEVRYKRMYLVADFECYKKKVFAPSVMTEDFKKTIPFIIIGEWVVGNDRENWVRGDRMNLQTSGFRREFTDNLAAVRRFIACLNDREFAELSIAYKRTFIMYGQFEDAFFERTVATTTDVLFSQQYPVKTFWITHRDWEIIPIEKRVFQYFKMKEPEKKDSPVEFEVVSS